MTALSKLMQARKEFHKRELKKSGWNDYSKFHYLEMADFLLPAMEIFDSLKLAAVTSFNKELATMTITDLEDGTEVVITSPFGSAALKACHEVQNIGAVETYQRRYLWVAALEIVEHDAIDASQGKVEPKPATKPISATQGVMESLPSEEQEYIQELAMTVVDILNNDSPAAANEHIKKENLDADQKTALWSLLDSKTRSALKKG